MTKTLLFSSDIERDDRPSDRPTRPTLPPCDDPSDDDLISLSERDFLHDDRDDSADVIVKASTLKPPPNPIDPDPPPSAPRRSWLLPALRAAAAGLLLLVAVVLLFDSSSSSSITPAREPRVAWPDRTSLAEPAVASSPSPASHSCIATASPRFVAPRARIDVGLDVSSTATGFVVALAPTSNEASAVRLEGSWLRAAESLRVHPNAITPIRRVVARDVDGALDVHADVDGSRFVVTDPESPPFRISLAGTYLVARTPERTHSLWSLPLRADALRVAPRDDGGAVVVVKRGNSLYLGLVNGALASMGPLQIITRPNAALGTPFVVANGGGAAVAWAERANGAREWTVMVASLGGGEMETKPIAAGMSPSLAVLPDGTLAVAYADGPPAAHRIVVRRLSADLTPSADLIVASPPDVNAGQPVIDIRSDGRALVAWLAVSRGQPAAVYATPLACDVSM